MWISLSDDPVPRNVLGAAGENEKLDDLDYLSVQIQKQGFQTTDVLRAFIKTGGPGDQIDLANRSSGDFGLRAELLQGRVKVLTKTDCAEWHCKDSNNHASYF